jgi:hypothetical protein
MNEKALSYLRAMDGYDRLSDRGVFERLTTGREDGSGAFTPGCGLSSSQAAFLIGFLNLGKGSRIENRLALMGKLEQAIVNVQTGETAFDVLLDMYKFLPEPKNLAWILDDLVEAMGGGIGPSESNAETIQRAESYMRAGRG